MVKKIKISVIIPAHNEESGLEKTLKSIKESDYENYEIIVVCDSCSDLTEKIAKKYAEKVYNVNFTNASKTRNFGVKRAEGEFLVFNDADTIVSKNYLSLVKWVFGQGGDYGAAKWISETDSLFGKYFAWANNRANKKSKVICGNCFIKKSEFNEVGMFDEKLVRTEDTDLGNRLKEKGSKYIFIEDAYYMPSERKFEKGFIRFWVKALYVSLEYSLKRKNRKKTNIITNRD